MENFEYRVFALGTEEIEKHGAVLNEAAEQGWELVSTYSTQKASGMPLAAYVMKRKKKEKAPLMYA